MDFTQVVANRRSIRRFLPKPVAQQKLDKILDSARLCQSAKNRQPWLLMPLTGQDKDGVANIMLDLFEQNDRELPGYMNSAKWSAQTIKAAPVLVLVFWQEEEGWWSSDFLSIGAAIEHMCLAAVDEGLGALWIADTNYTEKEICAAMGYPNLRLVSGVAIGYADEAPDPRPRKALDEILLPRR